MPSRHRNAMVGERGVWLDRLAGERERSSRGESCARSCRAETEGYGSIDWVPP